MEQVNTLLTWMMAKVDTAIEFFGLYTTKYSKWIVYALIIWVASFIFKIKLDFKTGGKK